MSERMSERDEEETIILMKSRDRRAERMSEFVTNMFQYNVTVGITRSEVIVCFAVDPCNWEPGRGVPGCRGGPRPALLLLFCCL